MQADEDQLIRDMRDEARDALEDKLVRLAALLNEGASDPVSALRQIRMDIHSLKGLAAAFRFSGMAIIAHRLEDYLKDGADLRESRERAAIQTYLDRLEALLDEDMAGGDLDEILRRLPCRLRDSFDPEALEVRVVQVMLVAPTSLLTRHIEKELSACGYRVTTLGRALDALEYMQHDRPDLVIASAILPGIDGVDLLCALRAMPKTRDIPLALLTSLGSGDERLRDLPAGVPILRKGPSFADDVTRALSQYRIL